MTNTKPYRKLLSLLAALLMALGLTLAPSTTPVNAAWVANCKTAFIGTIGARAYGCSEYYPDWPGYGQFRVMVSCYSSTWGSVWFYGTWTTWQSQASQSVRYCPSSYPTAVSRSVQVR